MLARPLQSPAAEARCTRWMPERPYGYNQQQILRRIFTNPCEIPNAPSPFYIRVAEPETTGWLEYEHVACKQCCLWREGSHKPARDLASRYLKDSPDI